jgi:hypothetical protein
MLGSVIVFTIVQRRQCERKSQMCTGTLIAALRPTCAAVDLPTLSPKSHSGRSRREISSEARRLDSHAARFA